MLRGYVEKVSENVVSGWIYSGEAVLTGKTVLAFVGGECVGSGKVERFRQDLLDAGLGDGNLGFSFFVTVDDEDDYARIVVRLDGSDAVLLQPNSKIVSVNGAAPKKSPEDLQREKEERLSTLRWMRGQGWLSQSDFDFLRFFRQFGVYDRTLTVQITGQEKTETELRDPAVVARELLLLYRMRDVDVQSATLASLTELKEFLVSKNTDPESEFVVALWSGDRGRLSVVEGSHLPDAPLMAQGSDYALGPDRLLFVDARCQFGSDNLYPTEGITAYFA